MRVVITCGPSYEPIDEVRRITNFSTGALGILLANVISAAGHEVICLKGVAATCCEAIRNAKVIPFTTNADLRERLSNLADRETVGSVFHAAALCDFRVKHVSDTRGERASAAKIPSRLGEISLVLEPAPKLIAELRPLFPKSWIVGWKYELEGTKEEALAKAREQMRECATDACVLNGSAYGAGFGVLEARGGMIHHEDRRALCEWLSGRLG
jgi:phosphopantothenate---cysteine ligase (CTP)